MTELVFTFSNYVHHHLLATLFEVIGLGLLAWRMFHLFDSILSNFEDYCLKHAGWTIAIPFVLAYAFSVACLILSLFFLFNLDQV